MSVIDITNAQRYNLGYKVNVAADHVQRFINDTRAPTQQQADVMDTPLTEAAQALADAGYGGVPAGSAVVADGQEVEVVTSVDAQPQDATVVVVDDALSSIKLTSGAVSFAVHMDNVQMRRYDGSTHSPVVTGQQRVADGVFSNVRLPATADIVSNGNTVQVRNSAGQQAHPATARVSTNGSLTAVDLADTTALVDHNQALTIPVTGTYTDTATLTVENGVVVGIVLS